ncbi:MAG: M24 family metallopeptidase [Eubacterium ramulus]
MGESGNFRLFSLDNPLEFKPGMTFAIETWCPSEDGTGSARIEEEIVVTETGHEVSHTSHLTRSYPVVLQAVCSRKQNVSMIRRDCYIRGIRKRYNSSFI